MIKLGQTGKLLNKPAIVVQIHDFGPELDYYIVGFKISKKQRKYVFGRSVSFSEEITYQRISKDIVEYDGKEYWDELDLH